jgi:putative ABC transport system substrate-binding protein
LRFVINLFVACLGTAILAHAAELPRIAELWPGDVARWNDAFIEGLRENGLVDGVTAAVHIRATGQDFESGTPLASDLIALDPNVIFVSPGLLGKHVLKELERTRKDIPVVVLSSDPVDEGLVPAAARHGRNITGLAARPGPEMATKHLQLIRDILPRASRVAYLMDTSWYVGGYYQTTLAVLERAGREMGIYIIRVEVSGPDHLGNL